MYLAKQGSTIHMKGASASIVLKVDLRFKVARRVPLIPQPANLLVSPQARPQLRLPQAHHVNQPHNLHQHQRDSNASQVPIRMTLGSVSTALKGDIDPPKVLKVWMNVKIVLEVVMGRELEQSCSQQV